MRGKNVGSVLLKMGNLISHVGVVGCSEFDVTWADVDLQGGVFLLSFYGRNGLHAIKMKRLLK
jgi:hypothetical protein